MNKGKVEVVSKAKSGKSWRVKIGEAWYGAKLDSKIEAAKGKTIEFEVAPDEGYGEWLGKWALVNGSAAAPAQADNGGEHAGLTEAEMRFISNVVGQALVAKTITEPTEVSVWAKAARATLRELA